MIERETINGVVFMAQTTYYIYRSEEDLQKGRIMLCTSNEMVFDNFKGAEIIKSLGLMQEFYDPDCEDHKLLPDMPDIDFKKEEKKS